MTLDEQRLSKVAAGFLSSLWPVYVWGMAMTMVGVFADPASNAFFKLLLIGWGMANIYLSVRVLFDARLFSELSSNNEWSLHELDETLRQLSLIKPAQGTSEAAQTVRSLTARILGTQRLVRCLVLSHLGQTLLLVCMITLF